jgi:hypothetical protein
LEGDLKFKRRKKTFLGGKKSKKFKISLKSICNRFTPEGRGIGVKV